MQLGYLADMGIAVLTSTYEEKTAYDKAGQPFPAAKFGMTWHRPTGAWVGRMTPEEADDLTMLLIDASGYGLPGLTDAAPQPAEQQQKVDRPVPPPATYRMPCGTDITILPHFDEKDTSGSVVLAVGDGKGRGSGCAFITPRGGIKPWKSCAGAAKSTALDLAEQLLNGGLAAWQEATTRYGDETCSCARCGRTLKNEVSVAFGIGPVCRSKMGAGW